MGQGVAWAPSLWCRTPKHVKGFGFGLGRSLRARPETTARETHQHKLPPNPTQPHTHNWQNVEFFLWLACYQAGTRAQASLLALVVAVWMLWGYSVVFLLLLLSSPYLPCACPRNTHFLFWTDYLRASSRFVSIHKMSYLISAAGTPRKRRTRKRRRTTTRTRRRTCSRSCCRHSWPPHSPQPPRLRSRPPRTWPRRPTPRPLRLLPLLLLVPCVPPPWKTGAGSAAP